MINNKSNKQVKQQRKQLGFGVFGFLGGAFLAMFFAVMGVALLPPYIENYSVQSCISSLVEDKSILKLNEANIKTALLKKLSVSSVSNVTEKNISIDKRKDTVTINVGYNVQAKFIKNVDFIVHFDEQQKVNL